MLLNLTELYLMGHWSTSHQLFWYLYCFLLGVVSLVNTELPIVVFFFFSRKTLQFQWTGAETGTFLIETNIPGEQILAFHSVI